MLNSGQAARGGYVSIIVVWLAKLRFRELDLVRRMKDFITPNSLAHRVHSRWVFFSSVLLVNKKCSENRFSEHFEVRELNYF